MHFNNIHFNIRVSQVDRDSSLQAAFVTGSAYRWISVILPSDLQHRLY